MGNLVISSSWICFTNNPLPSIIDLSQGVYEKAEEGLKVYGSENQNDKAIYLMPDLQNSIMSKTVYLKWKANGNVNVGVDIYTKSDNLISAGCALNLATDNTVSGLVLISENTWYYTRISVSSENISSITSTGNYDNKGGEVISSTSLRINGEAETFSFRTSADNTSYAILAESRIE